MINNWITTSGTFVIKELSAQDSVLKHLDIGTKYMECTATGVINLPSKTAFGTWEFDLYKTGDGNNIIINFITNGITQSDPLYRLMLFSDERIYVQERNPTGMASYTATSYINIGTWYKLKITRTIDGEFTIYIKGGTFGANYILVDMTGGAGTNPTTKDISTVICKNMIVVLGRGDKIANILIKEGVEQ